jgi:ADP-ribose pyrophosphatase YjhB (NUDIX family)
MKYCPDCGSLVEVRELEGRPRAFCPQCRRIHYLQLKVGAGAIIEEEGRLLLLQRTQQPFAGDWNLPAGYVEADESPRQAVIRETFEETGLQVEADELVDVYFFADDPRGNGILIVYRCHIVGGKLQETDEGCQPTFFTPQEIPSNLSGGGHKEAVPAWKEIKGK